MLKKLLTGAALSLWCLASPALALDSERFYSFKHWYVNVVTFDDGTLTCEASVSAKDVSFSLWSYADGTLQLQFYLENEWFGEEGYTKDIEVQIDRRSPWDLTNAEFRQNSIFFTLPASNQSAVNNFISEVSRGNRLYLNNQYGEEKAWYSLAGSSATIKQLRECQKLISRSGKW